MIGLFYGVREEGKRDAVDGRAEYPSAGCSNFEKVLSQCEDE